VNPRWRATIAAEAADSIPLGGSMEMKVTATNVGSATWRPSSPSGVGHVRLGLQLLDGEGRVLVKDFHRVALPRAIAPGETVAIACSCPLPPSPALYGLKCDLVAEGRYVVRDGGLSACEPTAARSLKMGRGKGEGGRGKGKGDGEAR
jgi:hypothetical protein